MSGTIAKLEHQWREFAHDKPGQRFENQHRRLKRGGRAVSVGMAVVGALLVASGVVLLFVPGPGLLVGEIVSTMICAGCPSSESKGNPSFLMPTAATIFSTGIPKCQAAAIAGRAFSS